MAESTEILLFFLSLCVSAFFSAAEAALFSLSADRIKQIIDQGGTKGSTFNFLSHKGNQILITILVGNNLVNIFAATLSARVTERYFPDSTLTYGVFITTLLILVFGEIVPKTFGRGRAEGFAYPSIKILQFIYYGLYPVVSFFSFLIVKILGKNAQIRTHAITTDEIEYMVNRADKEKTIDSKHIDLLASILEFPTIKVKNIMVPRTQVGTVPDNLSFYETLKLVKKDHYSRYPVCRDDDLDQTVGFLHVKDLAFVPEDERENFEIRKIAKEPFFVYEHMKIQAVFDHMNRKKIHLALVKDENGLVVGIVTLEDIIEEVLGEIQDEHDTGHDPKKDLAHGGSLVLPGQTNLREINNEYELDLPLRDNYSTLAGFLLEKLGNNFPRLGQIIILDGFSFELTKVVQFEIKEVKITAIDQEKQLILKRKTARSSGRKGKKKSSSQHNK